MFTSKAPKIRDYEMTLKMKNITKNLPKITEKLVFNFPFCVGKSINCRWQEKVECTDVYKQTQY